MADTVNVQIRFKQIVSVKGVAMEFNDSLYYPLADYDNVTPNQIEATKQQRIDAWKNAIENAPPAPVPTKQELQAQVAELQKQIDELNDIIAKK